MTKKHSFTWRKSIVFSATFLFIALVSVSCKKIENQIGSNTIDQNNILSSQGVDTFSLTTYSFVKDSTITKNNLATLLGSYNDPTFGTVNGEIFTQLYMQTDGPDFGDISTIAVDSFVLGLVYSGHYGKIGNQTLEVFEINDVNGIHKDSNYYQFSSLSSDSFTNLVAPGHEVVYMNPDNTTIINGLETPSQLRIHLDTNKARSIIEDSESIPGSFENNTAFSEYFKGLHIRTANGTQSPGQGGIMYFNMKTSLSKMTIYYTQAGVKKEYDFYISSATTHFNKVTIVDDMTRVKEVLDTPSKGQIDYYAQAFRSNGAIEMPTITDIKKNAIVHSCLLTLPVSHQTGVDYAPSGALRVFRRDPDNPNGLIILGTAVYSSVNKHYSFDLRSHIQDVVSGITENTSIIVAPAFFSFSADRIIFNGPESINKVKPSLRILYTEF